MLSSLIAINWEWELRGTLTVIIGASVWASLRKEARERQAG